MSIAPQVEAPKRLSRWTAVASVVGLLLTSLPGAVLADTSAVLFAGGDATELAHAHLPALSAPAATGEALSVLAEGTDREEEDQLGSAVRPQAADAVRGFTRTGSRAHVACLDSDCCAYRFAARGPPRA